MGIDWQPFQLKSGVSKTEFERMIVEQRRYLFTYWFGNDLEKASLQCPPIGEQVIFGHTDEIPEYADAIRLRPVAENLIFPISWKHELFTTCFPDEAARLVQKRIDWITKFRAGEFSTLLKLCYLEQTDVDLESTWKQLCECVLQTRKRQNKWTHKKPVVESCERIEALPSPRCFHDSFFAPYWKPLERTPWIDSVGPENLDDLVSQVEKTVQDYFDLCRDWNRIVKSEKCGCLAELFDSFQKRMNDPKLDEFFEWTQKWIGRGYGMFLS